MTRETILGRLPQAIALLVLSALLEPARASALPRATTTLPLTVLDVVPWPPLPTAPAISLGEFHELLRRQDTNTVCGFIGGDPNLPATCQPGSHCVLDRQHNAIGCCPNGEPTCSTGVFTGCVDHNSGPQAVVNPYVYTCQGSDVCYKNVFAGGRSQFGCGTASNLATSVQASASGITAAVTYTSIEVSFTAPLTTLSTPITINPSSGTSTRPSSGATSTTSQPSTPASSSVTSTSSRPTSSSASSTSTSITSSSSTSSSSRSTSSRSTTSGTTSSSSTSSSSSTTSTSTSSSTSRTSSSTSSAAAATSVSNAPSETGATAAPVNDGGGGGARVDRTGAIVGGTISGVAALVALVAVALFLLRRRKANVRKGPGMNGNTQYISPMTGGEGFQRLYDSNAAYETGIPPGAVTALPPAAAMSQQQAQYPPPNQGQQWQPGWQQQPQDPQQQQWQQWEQQQQQKWGVDANALVGYTRNSGTVRYVESNPTAAQVGQGNVAYVESVSGGSGESAYNGNPGFSAVAAVPGDNAGTESVGNVTEIASNEGRQSVQIPPSQGYHYPGQYAAAYAAAPAVAAGTLGVAGGLDRGSSQAASNYSGAGSSYYGNGAPAPSAPAAPSSTYGGASSVGRSVSIRGGGGGSMRSHPTPIASHFTSGAWAVQQRGSLRETDEYSRGYSDGLERIGEDEPLTTNMQDNSKPEASDNGAGQASKPSAYPGGLTANDSIMSRASGSSTSSNGGRPLWHQQNRMSSRNPMWM